ncbi:MAG: VOC family protein [Actinomycetota bacterium]|nr:VOC family protein [Actinomycetota bacterium]
MITVERTDFVAVPVSDLGRADEFYGQTLELARNPHASGGRWVEYETGNLTLGLSTLGGAIALRVPNVDDARRGLEQEGVEFPIETFDSGVCHGAPFIDADGNRLLLHRRYARSESWDPPATAVERTDFIGLPVRDRPTGVDFYGGTLGLRRNELASDEWPEFETGNATILLTTPEQTRSEFKPTAYSIALRVADVEATMERLRATGVEFDHDGVYETRVCHMAFFRDPDGNSLILHHRFAPYADGSLP